MFENQILKNENFNFIVMLICVVKIVTGLVLENTKILNQNNKKALSL